MKVVFIKDLKNVAQKNDIKEFSDGYAKNFLIRNGYAMPAVGQVLLSAKQIKNSVAQKEERKNAEKVSGVAASKGVTIELKAKSNSEGHLFAAIHEKDIAEALTKYTGVKVFVETIKLEKPIKSTGIHNVKLSWGGVVSDCAVSVLTA